MHISYPVVGGISAFWAFVGLIVPLFIPKGPNKGVTQWCLLMTAVCCWSFWAIAYLMQMNPLQGPQLKPGYIYCMAREWGNPIKSS